jgi:FADH2 O2-dependent halogenase
MFDIAVIGSGFGGSLLSLIARRLGRSVLLLEKGRHPRFAIGESSTPLADLLWLELTAKYDLPRLTPFAKWGTWRQEYPEIGCGLKRGFTFYHHTFGQPFRNAPDRSDQLVVAASPNDRIADTHWYRPNFDHFLVREATAAGVEYLDDCEVTSVGFDTNGARLQAVHQGRPREFRARFVVDAGNHRGALVRSLGLQDVPLPHLPPTQALFTHFRDVDRLEDLPLHPGMDRAPYPVDDAAVHHVFDGGWIWVLRFVNGITSAGVAATDDTAARWRLAEGAAAWQRLLADLPTVGRQFARARAVEPWVHAPRLAFRTTPAAGPGWALLPSAAGFVDPLLSSGFTLTLLGIERLAHALETTWDHPAEFQSGLDRHAIDTADDVLALEHYIAALYACMGNFEAFTEIARLYFAAVIYCETARRLGASANHGGFLLRRNPDFATRAATCLDDALAGRNAAQLREGVDAILNDFDLAGLADPIRRPWYPVLADDLRRARSRIGASAEQIEILLHRAGF